MKNNIIGTDISIDVCKAEGYMMADTNGEIKPDPKQYYRVFCYYPEYVDAPNPENPATDTLISWENLKETYQRHKKGIDSYADDMPETMNTDQPTWGAFINAASTINSYCGLD